MANKQFLTILIKQVRNFSLSSTNLNKAPVQLKGLYAQAANVSNRQNLLNVPEKDFPNVQNKKLESSSNDEAEWFTSSQTSSNYFDKHDQKMTLLAEQDINKKKEIIQKIIHSMNVQDFSLPTEFNEKEWNMLLNCKSMNEIRITLRKIPKDRYYKLLKEKQKLLVAKRREENLAKADLNEDGFVTNYPGNLTFLRRLDRKFHRDHLRQKLLASIRTNAPSVVFDFRYQTFHEKRYLLPSLYRQYIEIVKSNRTAPEPFQIYFCNYNSEGPFHKNYSNEINFDENLIQETSKSYLDLFPREKLVYLSKDSGKAMTKFDPEKVYIIGSIIDSGLREDRFASYSQAKRDGIECLRLPIDENIKWQNGSKDLAMNHVFEILIRLYHGKHWQEALKALPTRFTSKKIPNKDEF